MQTTYEMHSPIGREGQLWGSDHKSRKYKLPQRAQITELVIADASAAAGEDWTVVAIDEDTGQRFTLEFESGASVADTLAAMTAAASIGKFRDLFTATDDSTDTATWTAKTKGKTYSFETTTGGGSGTNTPSVTQTAIDYNGAGLPYGRAVVKTSTADEMAEIGASAAVSDICGVLYLTDANAFHSFENDSLSSSDACERDSMQRALRAGEFLALVEEAVTPSDPVYVRRALTSSAGRLGGFRASPAGGAQVVTATPSATNLAAYGFSFGWRGRHYDAYVTGDGTTTVAQACDGLIASLGSIDGLTISDEATHVEITTAAGEELDYMIESVQVGDVPAASVDLAVDTAADVDAIDASEIFEYMSAAAADELAVVKIKGLE